MPETKQPEMDPRKISDRQLVLRLGLIAQLVPDRNWREHLREAQRRLLARTPESSDA